MYYDHYRGEEPNDDGEGDCIGVGGFAERRVGSIGDNKKVVWCVLQWAFGVLRTRAFGCEASAVSSWLQTRSMVYSCCRSADAGSVSFGRG